MSDVILTMHYPKSGITQMQEHPSIHAAITVAHGHLAGFPDGYAQISDKASGQVLMPNEELRATLDTSRRRVEPVEAVSDTPTPPGAGLLARWFGRARDGGESQPA
jgi:hypothetical protein